jgi:D-beta-D-heptose 7-phosphate kinase/D-beta-D-heptose 1-phosphate adenosyltransferase
MYTRPLLHTGRPIVERFAERIVVVIGDIMLDHFLLGHVDRISPEAPVPVVEFTRNDYRLGGAANVAHNVRALGGSAVLVGLVGADETADLIRAEVQAAGLRADGLVVDATRPSTRKMRIVTDRHQQVARVDYEDDREASGAVEAALIATAERLVSQADVIVVSDYLKGVVTRGLMQAVMTAAHARGIAVLVDPKIPHVPYYAGATLITPNHHEAESATHRRIRTEADAREAARLFRRLARCQSVMITRGEHGMWLLDAEPVAQVGGRRADAVAGAAEAMRVAVGEPKADDVATSGGADGAASASAAAASSSGAPASNVGSAVTMATTTQERALAVAPRHASTEPADNDEDIWVEMNLAARAQEVTDVTGAGDTVIATVAMGFAAGATLAQAADLANHAAGVAVAKFGPAAVTREELLRALDAAAAR